MTQLMLSAAGLLGFVNFGQYRRNEKCYHQNNKFIWLHWAVTSVNYWILPVTTQNTFSALINSHLNK